MNFIVYKDSEIKKMILDGDLEVIAGAKSIYAPVYKAVAELKPGQHLFISNEQWKQLGGKSKPFHIAAYINQALNNTTGRKLGKRNESYVNKLQGYEVRMTRYSSGSAFYVVAE